MTKAEFQSGLTNLLNRTLETGPGPRAVSRAVANSLFEFICNEAGYQTPSAIEEVINILRTRLAETEKEMIDDEPKLELDHSSWPEHIRLNIR
jgi:hypothetical protein